MTKFTGNPVHTEEDVLTLAALGANSCCKHCRVSYDPEWLSAWLEATKAATWKEGYEAADGRIVAGNADTENPYREETNG